MTLIQNQLNNHQHNQERTPLGVLSWLLSRLFAGIMAACEADVCANERGRIF
jgi:hypothetical protein